MYKDRESLIKKISHYIKCQLYLEALNYADEISRRWPKHPSGWSYKAELYGNYLGFGNKASKCAKEALKYVKPGDFYYEAVCSFAFMYPSCPKEFTDIIERLKKTLPNTQNTKIAIDTEKSYKEYYSATTWKCSNSDLFSYHIKCANLFADDRYYGLKGSHLELAINLIKSTNFEDKINYLKDYTESLKEIHDSISSVKRSFGLDFSPDEMIILHRRIEVFEKELLPFLPNDYKILNKLSGTYMMINENTKAIYWADKTLSIHKYDKPLVNKAIALKNIANLKHRILHFDEAVNHYEKAKECLELALKLGGDKGGQEMAEDLLKEINDEICAATNNYALAFSQQYFNELIDAIFQLNKLQKQFQDKVFTPKWAAKNARIRFKLNGESDFNHIIQWVKELIEDSYPIFVVQTFLQFTHSGFLYERLIKATAVIATNHHIGAMSNDAKYVLAFALLLSRPDDSRGIFTCFAYLIYRLQSVVKEPRELLLKSIECTFGFYLSNTVDMVVDKNIANNELPPGVFKKDSIWWYIDSKKNFFNDVKLYILAYGIIGIFYYLLKKIW